MDKPKDKDVDSPIQEVAKVATKVKLHKELDKLCEYGETGAFMVHFVMNNGGIRDYAVWKVSRV